MAVVEFLGFARRNPSFVTRNARRSWAVAKAMRRYRDENPVSPWSGKPVAEVHHIVPVSVDPLLADEPANFIGFASRDEHYVIGHLNVSWMSYNARIWETVAAAGRVDTIEA